MQTAGTLCATGAGIALASVGLTVVREHHPSRSPSSPSLDMTALAYPQLHVSPNSRSAPHNAARSVSEGHNGKVRSGKARLGQKRVLTPRASFQVGADETPRREQEERSESRAGTPGGQSRSWLRRLSSSMSTSRESSQAAASRPSSAAVSHSNGSLSFSQTGSTTPMFSGSSSEILPARSSSPLPPNKLVKRASSIRSSNSSPFQNSGSRLPVPVFRRPATSHDRSFSLQQTPSSAGQSDRMSIDGDSSYAREPHFRQYFTPKISSGIWSMRRRTSSGIPKPIKRLHADRNYTPILVSATPAMKPNSIQVAVDDEPDIDEHARFAVGLDTTSSPLPLQKEESEEGPVPRRSFSDLLSSTPPQIWKRATRTKTKSPGNKSSRRERPRVVSAPHATMGSSISTANATNSERPAKRRDLTDHELTSRNIYSSASSTQRMEVDSHQEISLNLNGADSASMEVLAHPKSSSPLSQHRLPSATLQSTVARSARVSAAQSEITSTGDSDSEYRSIGDDSTDYQSDAVYDSYRTRTTRSSSGRRGPHIEKIFDESPPTWSSGRSTKLKDFLNDGEFGSAEYGVYRNCTIEEEESTISTPVRSLRENSITSTPSARPGVQQNFQSSPPAIIPVPDTEDIDWDAFDRETPGSGGAGLHTSPGSPNGQRSLPFLFDSATQPHTASTGFTPIRHDGSNTDRTNIFDWSETQPSPNASYSPPRPKTMYGKKGQDSRGSRATGRRAPSGMHARSHSVPVVPDVGGRRNNVVVNKFGTWGVGSKAVTEDWNDDFDFDDFPAPIPESVELDERRVDSGNEMYVPRSIREHQRNVLANIGLLREWGLLIEELKELRVRAVALGMMEGPYAEDWQEVDAMIELADQETEEQTLESRQTPPSSPSFDYGAFDESTTTARARGPPLSLSDSLMQDGESPAEVTSLISLANSPQHPFTSRARKDSEAVARSVIEALQSKRSVSDPTTDALALRSKKVPFDTATLRHIVPYVDRLKRKVKEGLRETEGLHTSPNRGSPRNIDRREYDDDMDDQPAFRSIFNEPQSNDKPSRRRSRRDQAATDHDGSESASTDQRSDLANRMQSMNLPR